MEKMFSEKVFENYKVYEYDLCGRKLVIESGKMAGLANGSVLIRYGETVLLCCATASASPREGIDFFGKFLTADCDKISIENPVGIISGDYIPKWFPDLAEKFGLPMKPTQIIHPWMQGLPRYTVTYCQYGEKRMKPTDIWTNHPNPMFKSPCKNGDTCHEAAPRGARTGTQGLKGTKERSVIPPMLCEHVVKICEERGSSE